MLRYISPSLRIKEKKEYDNMKVLLFNGSPREHGCTYTALVEVAETLQKEGVEAEILWLGNQSFQDCIACGTCAKHPGACVLNDGMVNNVIEAAKTADGYIFGSPVYYASPSGRLLSLMDRMFYAGGASFANKPAAAVVSARRAGTTCSMDVINKYFSINNMPIVSSNYWNMVHGNNPDEVLQDEEGLQIMRILGQNMAWLLKCIEAGKKEGIDIPKREAKVKTNFIR